MYGITNDINYHIIPQQTTIYHINIKQISGTNGKPYGDSMLITQKDLQKVYTLNNCHFPILIHYKETIKILVNHINETLCDYTLRKKRGTN